MSETVILRRCYSCKAVKSIDQFRAKKDRPFGKGYQCKSCVKWICKDCHSSMRRLPLVQQVSEDVHR